MDRRKKYILVMDTETANTLTDEKGKMDMSNVLVYDCGFAIVDKQGNIYETASFVNYDIFIREKELMKSAYYADKIPHYEQDLKEGTRQLATTKRIRREMLEMMGDYGTDTVCAHNARFDYNALNITQRYITASYFRCWFPYGTEIWDTMRMARDVIHKMPSYRAFCQEHGYLTKNGQLSTTAENLYRFITNNPDFTESHTGLEDVKIESQILAYCFKQKKAMRKRLWEPFDTEPPTQFQRDITVSLKKEPVLRGF